MKNGLTRPLVAALGALAMTGTLTFPALAASPDTRPHTTTQAGVGVGEASCPSLDAFDTRTRQLGSLLYDGDRYRFWPTTRLGIDATSQVFLIGSTSIVRDNGENFPTRRGDLFIDKRGNAVYVRIIEDSVYTTPVTVRGPFAGLRYLLEAGPSGNADRDQDRTTMLYGVTNAGNLVSIPVSWDRAGLPSFGRQQHVASGFGGFTAMKFNAWKGRNWIPTEDRFLAITNSGRLVETTVTRGRAPKASSKLMAETRLTGVTSLSLDRCMTIGREVSWIVRPARGAAVQYTDPDFWDNSFKGVKREQLKPIEARIRTF